MIVSIEQLNHWVNKHLPQSKMIPIERRERWLAGLLETEKYDASFGIAPRPEWHVMRAGGIGSSEIGGLVRAFRGESVWFGGPHEVVASKLFYLPPSPSTPDTRRGTLMEPMIRQMFYDKFARKGVSIRSHPDLMDNLRYPSRNGPIWERANPDDLVEIDGRLFIVDYKAPRTNTLEDYQRAGEINFDYAAQLHHIHNRMKRDDIHVSGMLLVSFDYNNYDIDIASIDLDTELAHDIEAAGGEMWENYVMKGIVPEYESTCREVDAQSLSLNPQTLESLNEAAKRLVMAFSMERSYEKIVKDMQSQIKCLLEGVRLGGDTKLRLPGVIVTAKEELDPLKVYTALVMRGRTNLKTIYEDRKALEEAARWLTEQGVDAKTLSNESYIVKIAQNKTGPHAEFIEACRATASACANLASLDIPEYIDTTSVISKPNHGKTVKP